MLPEKPWRAEAVMQLCAAQFACLCLGIGAIGVLHKLGVHGFVRDESFGNILVGTFSFQGAAWVLILLFLRQHKVDWLAAFGFRGPGIKHPALLILAVIIVFFVVWGLQWASINTLERFGFPPEDEAAVKLFTDAKSWWTILYLGVFAVVIAPVAEEFIFRGMLYPFVKKLGWPKLAWFGVSFLFALIHLNAPTFVPLFALALALTWLYERTDNLLAPITAHALFNATNLVLLYFGDQINQWIHGWIQLFYHFLHQA